MARAAISNAIAEESTGWKPPSFNLAFTSTTGKPRRIPFMSSPSVPLITAGTYSLGTVPPTTSLVNSKPSPGLGSKVMQSFAYCPEPPDCFLWVYHSSIGSVMVSRYATWGLPMFASTLNSRLSRSMMISKCSSPMPSMTVWLDSSSRLKRKEGSSAASFASASPNLSASFWESGSQETLITGSGNSIFSRTMGESMAHKVSPVVVSFKPTMAMMSPAWASLISSRLFECISTIRPMRSLDLVLGFHTISPAFTLPE
mmetsp:Transcript_68925/g.162070  ORF Transcript_68925/g.162070 Transcript_68925/m.162070 type:complete len:257 (-) Transcript_68925:1321-2091(-)